jgi:hypothetical protein
MSSEVDHAITTFPKRLVILDFHTGPDIPDVGVDFDATEFAAVFAAAHVDSVQLAAKCHHGLLYCATARPERHPGLPVDLDLLGAQIEALHGAGIRAPIYFSVQCDEYAAAEHPEWIAVDEELRRVKRRARGAFEAGWSVLDMSSPYQDYLADQIVEVMSRYGPADGVILDMCWDQPSCSQWAITGMKREGLDPREPSGRGEFARLVSLRYMDRFRRLIEPHLAAGSPTGVWFNSRPKANLLQGEAKLVRNVEVESLPTGGWGYAYFPYVARLVRGLGVPAAAHTGRFHGHWGDVASLKSAAALKYECGQMYLHGFSAGIGDALHPRGRLDTNIYGRIGEVYGYLASCDSYLAGMEAIAEVALVVDAARGDNPGPAVAGAVRALQELRQQFDVVTADSDLGRYRLLVVPESTPLDGRLSDQLRERVAAGACLLIGLGGVEGQTKELLGEMGIEVAGTFEFSHMFLRLDSRLGSIGSSFDVVVAGETLKVVAGDGADVVCELVEPYFERTYEHFSGHGYTPPAQANGYPGVLQRGRVICFAAPLFGAFGAAAYPEYREVIGECIRRLMPDPVLRIGGPVHLESSLRQREHMAVAQVLSYLPSRQGDGHDMIWDAVPLVDVPLSVRLDFEPVRVRLQPSGKELPFDRDGTYCQTQFTCLDGYGLVVFEGSEA